MSKHVFSGSIKLGLMPPLTGVVGIYGTEITEAARIACVEINDAGGLLGKRLELVIEDDGSQPDTAVAAANKLIDDYGCVAIIGNLLSNSRISVASQVAEPKRIPYLNFSFYEGSIASRYFFNFGALPNQQINKMIPYMALNIGSKIYFAGTNYEWPRGSIDAAKLALDDVGGQVVGEQYLSFGATPDQIEELINNVAHSGADVFVPYFAGNEQLQILKSFHKNGLKERMAVVMGHYDEVMSSHLSPEVREGLYSCNSYFMSVDTLESKQYLRKLADRSSIEGIWPNGNGVITNFGEGTYLCVHAFADAIREANSLSAEAIVDALENIHCRSLQGEIKMDAATHHASVNSYLAQCQNDGTFQIIKKFGLIAPVIPDRFKTLFSSVGMNRRPEQSLDAIHAEKRAILALQKQTAQDLLLVIDVAIISTDVEGTIIDINKAANSMFGYLADELIGQTVHILIPPHIRNIHAKMIRGFASGPASERRMGNRPEATGYRKDGTFFPAEISIAKVENNGKNFLVATIKDISRSHEIQEQTRYDTNHDRLTGLFNRTVMCERITNALERGLRNNNDVGLLYIDIDKFQAVNDIYGYEKADILLVEIAKRLINQARPGDTVARIASDEFVVLCERLKNIEDISNLAERTNAKLREPFYLDDAPIYITASIGIAISEKGDKSAEELLSSADVAKYSVKEKGSDGWQFFSKDLQQIANNRLEIAMGLQSAIQQNEFQAFFQPIVAVENEKIKGAELLLRWFPEAGAVSPAEFIPIAETSGIIDNIGEWVFREGCRAQAEWSTRWGDEAPYVSINVSTRQLDNKNLLDSFSRILKEFKITPNKILLEITETSLMSDIKANLELLNGLSELGLNLAIDDFGTGHSSLAQLTRLPIKVLKIDKSFIDDMHVNKQGHTVIQAIIGLAKGLGLKLIAEGVEDAKQVEGLKNSDCDLIQGYYFYRPMPAADLLEVVEKSIGKS